MQLFGEKLLFQAIKMTYPKTKLPPITCRGDQKWTKIWPQKPKIGSNWTLWVLWRQPQKDADLKGFWPWSQKLDQNWPKNGQKRSKMTKIGSNLGFGVKVGDFWGKRDGRHTKNEPKAIFGVWKLVLTRIFGKRSGRLPEIQISGFVLKGVKRKIWKDDFLLQKWKISMKIFDERKMGKMKIM